jgi:short subunit dehydrogenase-like uncharacterized protein
VIALLGATGYTGKLVAEELARRRLPHRLGARSPERLSALPNAADRETFVVDASQPARLDAFLDGADALINTVGPFLRLSLPVVEATVRNEVPYVDSTGEQEFMSIVYDRFSDAPVPIVPACAAEYIPQDLAAAIAMSELSAAAHEVAVHTRTTGALPSRGSARTMVEMAESMRAEARVRRVPFPSGVRTVPEIPFGDRAIARHANGARVVTTFSIPGLSGPAARLLPVVLPRLGPIVDRLPEGPSPRARQRARFEVLAEAIGETGRAAVTCWGRDVYGMTARFLVEAAMRVRGRGAMAPAEALHPAEFFQAVSGARDGMEFGWRRLDA